MRKRIEPKCRDFLAINKRKKRENVVTMVGQKLLIRDYDRVVDLRKFVRRALFVYTHDADVYPGESCSALTALPLRMHLCWLRSVFYRELGEGQQEREWQFAMTDGACAIGVSFELCVFSLLVREMLLGTLCGGRKTGIKKKKEGKKKRLKREAREDGSTRTTVHLPRFWLPRNAAAFSPSLLSPINKPRRYLAAIPLTNQHAPYVFSTRDSFEFFHFPERQPPTRHELVHA